MDWEAPVDAWYAFLAVSLVSVAVAGVVLGLPTGAPPDANQAANTIEPVAGSSTEASARWEYRADTIVISDISSPTVGWAGDPPLEYTVDYEDGTWSGNHLDIDETLTWDNEIERSADFDVDAPFVEQRDETNKYHVTLVTA